MVYALLKGDTRSHITLKQYENDNEERGIVVAKTKKQQVRLERALDSGSSVSEVS
jgi:hypothetical protein